ncbi:MAG: DUF2784 domain-containing protein [Pseudomonadota bacterium]
MNPQVAAFLADALVLVHLVFVAFVLAGGLLLLRWPRLAWVHLPAATWGAAIEFAGAVCPLTPLENTLRAQAGEAGYRGGFVEHYLLPVLYPAQLTPAVQLWLGTGVVVVNLAIYAWVCRARRRRDQSGGRSRP